jgi:predicted Zn-dependent protease
VDNDGWPDFYGANDLGKRNLQRNNGDGTFTDIAKEAGVANRAIQEFQKPINLKGHLALAHSRHAQAYKHIGEEDRAEQELSRRKLGKVLT